MHFTTSGYGSDRTSITFVNLITELVYVQIRRIQVDTSLAFCMTYKMRWHLYFKGKVQSSGFDVSLGIYISY